jgi:uncharacterized protein (DUF1330 family)
MEPYRAAVGATIEQYGGCFLARAGATELIEGGPEPKRSHNICHISQMELKMRTLVAALAGFGPVLPSAASKFSAA